MKRNNIDIIDLSVGEPDFSTPLHIKQAAIKAIHNNFTKYTLNNGIIELRQAIVQKLNKDNQRFGRCQSRRQTPQPSSQSVTQSTVRRQSVPEWR